MKTAITAPSNKLEGQIGSVGVAIGGWRYEPPKPFDISLAEFRRLSYEVVASLQKEVRRLCSRQIEDAWKRGMRQVVIVNNKVIFETKDIEDIPNEKIRALAEEHRKPCYTFTAPDLVEESGWTMVDSDDHYPTLGLYVGPEDSKESSLENFFPVDADFDTGNPNLKVFDASRLRGDLSQFDALDLRETEHFGKPYSFYQKKVKICVRDESNKIHSVVTRVRLVRDWAGCGLLQYSPNRTGFVGRDMLHLLRIKAELDPTKRVTRVYGISS
ncbi:MAG: hypothetical protein LYZ66_04745 [Nitrososphaerales archaeon]|nr:hypothetical protein [Nitrososphaerales archaeon]